MKKILLTLILLFGVYSTPSFAENSKELLEKGLVNITEKKYDLAEKDLLEYLKLDDKNYQAFVGLGEIYLEKNDKTKSKEFFDRAIGTAPENLYIYNLIKSTYSKKNEYLIPLDYYKKYLEKTIKIDDSVIYSFNEIADYFYKNNQKQKALEIYNYLLAKLPNNTEVKSYLAIFYLKENNIKKFNEYKDITLKLYNENNKNKISLFLISSELTKNNKPKEALEFLQKINKKYPDSNIFFEIAVIYKKINNIKAAENNLIKALELDQVNNQAKQELGLIYFEQAENLAKNTKTLEQAKIKIFKAYELLKSACTDDTEKACEYQEEKIPNFIKKYGFKK
ncbi:MAG: tetratricopeptide repeat protein [Candidatus Sericytochromatia bacterium]